MHDCEILTSHGGDSHDIHDYPSADYLGMDFIHLPLVIAMPWDLLSHAVVFKAQMRAKLHFKPIDMLNVMYQF